MAELFVVEERREFRGAVDVLFNKGALRLKIDDVRNVGSRVELFEECIGFAREHGAGPQSVLQVDSVRDNKCRRALGSRWENADAVAVIESELAEGLFVSGMGGEFLQVEGFVEAEDHSRKRQVEGSLNVMLKGNGFEDLCIVDRDVGCELRILSTRRKTSDAAVAEENPVPVGRLFAEAFHGGE